MKLADLLRTESWPVRIRKDIWANPKDYICFPSGSGVWCHLYAPAQPLIGAPTPQSVLLVPGLGWDISRDQDEDWLPYEGPLNACDNHGSSNALQPRDGE